MEGKIDFRSLCVGHKSKLLPSITVRGGNIRDIWGKRLLASTFCIPFFIFSFQQLQKKFLCRLLATMTLPLAITKQNKLMSLINKSGIKLNNPKMLHRQVSRNKPIKGINITASSSFISIRSFYNCASDWVSGNILSTHFLYLFYLLTATQSQ